MRLSEGHARHHRLSQDERNTLHEIDSYYGYSRHHTASRFFCLASLPMCVFNLPRPCEPAIFRYNRCMLVLKIFLAGWLVLLGAIVINAAAGALGLPGWYDLLRSVGQAGLLNALRAAGLMGLVFLLLIYPALLGALAYLAAHLLLRS